MDLPRRRAANFSVMAVLSLGALGALAGMAAMAGCGRPQATIRHIGGGPDETVEYDSATFQMARDKKVQVVLFRRTAAPIGEADPDFEYVFFEVPERSSYGWLREDHVPVYRWVREGKHDRVWLGTAGRVRLREADVTQPMHFEFHDVTMEPVAGTSGGTYLFNGHVTLQEDPVETQGLINRYGEWLGMLIKPKPVALPAKSRKK